MRCAAVVLLLASGAVSPVQAKPPPPKLKVLVMDVAAAGLDAATIENITGLVAVILTEDTRLDVLSGADVKQMVALEGDKAAMGCASDASCLADVAGAMGAGLIVYGNGGQLGTLLNLNLNLFDAGQAKSVGRVAVQAKSLEELPDKLRPAVVQLITNGIGSRASESLAAGTPGPSMLPMAALASGGLLAVIGGAVIVVGVLPATQIADAEQSYVNGDASALDVARALHSDWYDNALAPGLIVGGAVAAVAGTVLAVVGVTWMGGGE
jgi:hypothetical protein